MTEPTKETRPLPQIALTALRFLDADFKRSLDLLCGQALASMNLAPEMGWKVDASQGIAIRDVPAEAPPVTERTLELMSDDQNTADVGNG